jgi:quercetin dioxygenase-like cupin family protein
MHIGRTPTIAASAQWFTGAVWIDTIETPDGLSRNQVDSVHLAPGARTVWHRHPRGQVSLSPRAPG